MAPARAVRSCVILLAALTVSGPGPSGLHAPAELAATGLYVDFANRLIDPAHLAFSPQYPLWTDGATKRRWASFPPGTVIDGSDPDVWQFPPGTRFWKEFAFDGRPVETRLIERLDDGSWRYAAYEWSEDGSRADLVSPRGHRNVHPLAEGRAHSIPGVSDCKVCHEAGSNRILGFGALQLSPDRDPEAPHAEASEGEIDLAWLLGHGLLANYPAELAAPRIVAKSPEERTALGYLHGNCGHCHHAGSKVDNIGLFLRHDTDAPVPPALASVLDRPVRKMAPGQSPSVDLRVAPGHPERSALFARMGSRRPALQMPPLGTEMVDREAVDLIRRWIAELEVPPTERQEE